SDSSIIHVEIEAYDQGGGIDELRLYQNGKLIYTTGRNFKPKTSDEQYKQLNLDVRLAEGTNRLTVIALNDERIESFPDLIEVAYKSFVVPRSKIHMLVIGINEYKNNGYNLNYARDDAQAFTKAIRNGANGIFKEIVTYEFYDKKATAENILAAFDKIIHTATEEDVFVFYYAGHGVMYQDDISEEYFLCPTDVTKMYGNKRILTAKGISATQLNNFCKRVRAQKQLILLDACQSGGATEVFSFRGPVEEKAMIQLARSTGVALIAASGSKQYATEVESLGHGVFTYCILKALEGDADTGISDQKITVGELRTFLETRIPEMSELYKGVTQYPTAYSSGQDFPIVISK
ncbi:MAG: caspase family protein, partial [Bacteroidota bacterium]